SFSNSPFGYQTETPAVDHPWRQSSRLLLESANVRLGGLLQLLRSPHKLGRELLTHSAGLLRASLSLRLRPRLRLRLGLRFGFIRHSGISFRSPRTHSSAQTAARCCGLRSSFDTRVSSRRTVA